MHFDAPVLHFGALMDIAGIGGRLPRIPLKPALVLSISVVICMVINKYTVHLTHIYYIYGIVRYCVVTGQAVEYSIRLIA